MNHFLKTSYKYFVANILSAATPFFLIPILTRYLTIEQYGQVAMFQLLVAGLAGIVGVNTVGSSGRKYFDSNISSHSLALYNTCCIWALIGSALITLLTMSLFEEKLSSILSIPASWIYVALIVSIGSYVFQMRLTQWQIRSDAGKYATLQIINSILFFGTSLILVVSLSMEAEGRIWAQLITVSIIAIFAFINLYKHNLLLYELPIRKYMYECLSFGLPLVPHIFGGFLLLTADRYVINENLGLEAVGLYLLAVQLSGALQMIFDAINKAYIPFLFSSLKSNDEIIKKRIVKYTYYYFIFLLISSFIAFYVSPFLVNVIADEKFVQAGEVIGWLILGQVFGGMYLMVTNYIFYSKETKFLSFVTISCGCLNIILLYILIPGYGLKGAAFSFCFAMFVRFILTWYIASKKVSMPWFSRQCLNNFD